MKSVYREHRVFSIQSGAGVWMYTCFERLVDGYFAVHIANLFLCSNFKHLSEELIEAETVSMELLLEADPSERCSWYSTIDDAISAHDLEFGNN